MFFVWFGICFVCYAIRTVFNVMIYNKHPWAESKKIINFVFLVMGILWFSWFSMCFADPVGMSIPDWIRYAGFIFFLAGVFLFVFSHIKLRGFEDKKRLVMTGIYSRIRNPMYLGFILWIIGFPVFTRSFVTLASSVMWIAFIMYWKGLEEKELMRRFKHYREYMKRTWF